VLRLVALGKALKVHTSDAPSSTGFVLRQVALAALLVVSVEAHSLGLGRMSVQSALGETMRAEIDITSLSSEEASTLRARIAPADTFRSTGVEFNPVLTSTQVNVVRLGGKPVLRLTSDRAVQEPFVDVILELTWAGGRLVREYTLLFDPPSLAKPAPAAVAAAPVAAEPVAPPPPAAAVALPRPPAPASAPVPRAAAPAPVAAAPAPAQSPAPAPRPTSNGASEYIVEPGDSLSKIAAKTQVTGISLDQMLVGLFRQNPSAFIESNMNRLRAGAVLQVPDSEALNALSPSEARQVILAQSADFSAYRQRLASVAPLIPASGDERKASGQVQAAVEDRKPAAAPKPDKLMLSKPSGPSSAPETSASKASEKKDVAARVAELTRNVEELKQLSAAVKPAPGAQPGPAAAPASTAMPTVAAPVVAQVASAAPAPVAANAASQPASRPAAPVVAPPPVQEAPSFLDSLLDSPFVLPVVGVLVAVLGGIGLVRMRSRRPSFSAETGFHESRLQPDSFFGGTGGQRVDTRDAQHSGQSSMSYSLSQLDAIGDVDPVAEADVYLAYGRDLQAEEILKEALRANPSRLAIRLKLLEVYAKRRDTKGFEQLAIQLYAETKGTGEDWAKAQEMGRGLDPENPLYQPGGAPLPLDDGSNIRPEPMNATTLPQTALPPLPKSSFAATDALSRSGPDTGPVSGFDLGLDLDLSAPEPVSTNAMVSTQAMPASVEHAPMPMDLDVSRPGGRSVPPAPDLGFDAKSRPMDIEFDLGMDTRPGKVDEPTPDRLADAIDALSDDDGDPLVRQLELAEEFRQIGDTEGAREVLQELVEQATGSIKTRALAMLEELR
jgi:pilus assembly protein FimV